VVSFPIYYQLKAGDVSSRGKIRQENNCKPFKYFLDHVREIIHLYVPENLKASGAVYGRSITTAEFNQTCIPNNN
jgi:hypothetical protein